MQGKGLTNEQRQSVLGISQQLAPVMNIASALMPSRLADAIYGNGGNPLRLNQGLLTTGQNMYDPITGARGLTGATAGAMGERIYNRLYADPVAASQMLGTGTAELSDLLDNLKQRGLLGEQQSLTEVARNLPSVSTSDASITEIRKRANARGETVDDAGVLAQYDQMRALGRAGDPASLQKLKDFATTTTGQEILRAGDADRIAQKLKNYNEAIVAVRDIFGDSGRPDAPMAELMASLDQLTQGGLATQDPATLARSVRKTYELGRMNNFSLPVIQGLMAQASAQAQAAGLDPQLTQNITQNAMAFGASKAVDRIMSNPGFGGFNREKLLLTEMQLQTGAAASPTAQRLGAIVAMYKQNQPLTAAMQEIAEIAMGQRQGTLDLTKLSQSAVMAELQRGGMSTQTAAGFLRNKQQAQEQILEYDIGGKVRAELQPQAFRRAMQRTINRTIGDERISSAVTEKLFNLGINVNKQSEREKALDEALAAQGVTPNSPAEKAMMAKFNVTSRDALIRDVSSQLHNALQSSSKIQLQFGNYQTAVEIMSPEARRAAAASPASEPVAGIGWCL